MKLLYTILGLSCAGFIFSGYLSSVKFFSNSCAFGETCPLFFGKPACYVGFALFTLLLIGSILLIIKKTSPRLSRILSAQIAVSIVGILFAGFFTFREISQIFSEGLRVYVMGLPTCAWGLLFFGAIACTSIFYYRRYVLCNSTDRL